MKIMSEKTGKEYASVEACLAAEKEYDDAIAAKKAAEEKALAERKAKNEKAIAERKEAASKVEEKRKALIEARKAFQEELSQFCERFGAYHYTIKNGEEPWSNLFDNFFENFWF